MDHRAAAERAECVVNPRFMFGRHLGAAMDGQHRPV